ncbi:MAG: XRE family transcriptional regulator [Bacteroidales bacterium]|nr:XRE family transcriptional regulator [Bacteroidales bacterium]MBR6265377.1 XRE family transcriptional regulator [Bacteroidales bacterium]
MEQTTEDVHIGKLIQQTLKKQGRSPSWLAEQINCNRDNIYKIYQRSNINTELLMHISIVLKVDFFEYYEEMYKKQIQNV